MQTFDYLFNVGGDFSAKIQGMTEATGEFSAKVESAQTGIGKLASMAAKFNVISEAIQNVAHGFDAINRSGIDLDSQMHDLSAVAGVTGDKLKEIEGYARDSAKAFGTDAGVAVEGYKLLLSQLTPELAKCPEALSEMGRSIQVTSKLMGGDGVAAAQVLTTAMNQYGVSMDDPIKASKVMAQMMNTMAAAGQAGSAELPAISAALQQAGMAAKAANVSFEETNAAIQVLDKAGKKASEGGVALRNTLAILGQGRFLPKETREELERAGVDVMALADKNRTLKERLELLKPVLNDSALFSKLFGMENANAARALVQGTEQLEAFTQAVTGTNSAEEQAAIIMDSYAEKQARIQQQIEDLKISVFQVTDGFPLWASSLSEMVLPFAQIVPLFQAMGTGIAWVKALNWTGWLRSARLGIVLMTDAELIHNKISLGFIGNIGRATLMLARFATVGIMQGIKALGAWVLSLVTGGTASATFAATASASFTAFQASAVSACRAVGIAIMNIPIVGWIAAAIAGLIALGTYFWKTSATFRAVLKGAWAAVQQWMKAFSLIGFRVFTAFHQLINAAFHLDVGGMKKALTQLKNGVVGDMADIGTAFVKAYDAEMTASTKKQAKTQAQKAPSSFAPDLTPPQTTNVTGSTLSTTGSGSSSGGQMDRIKNITINVQSLVDKFEIQTASVAESAEKIKEVVAEALLGALNDVNLA